MPETVEINEELSIIEVLSFGDVTFKRMTESIDKVRLIHEKTGFNNLFIDTGDLASIPPVADMFPAKLESHVACGSTCSIPGMQPLSGLKIKTRFIRFLQG